MKKIFKFRTIAIIVVIMFISVGGQSQIAFDPNAQDAMVPLDGGLSLLLGAGAVYGIRKLRKKN
jgi:hypothetical protein